MWYVGKQGQSIDLHQRSRRPMFMESSNATWRNKSMGDGRFTGESVDHFIGWVDSCSTWGSILSGHLQLFGCHQDTVDPSVDWNRWSTARSSVVEWKYYHPSFDRELPRCVSDQWSVDRWKELHPDFRSSIGSVEECQELGSPSFIVRWWRTFIRCWLPPQQSSSVEFSTDGSSDSLEAVSTSTPWTAETLLRTREATVDRWSDRIDRRTRLCLCVQCSSTTTSDEHRTWTRTERWTITTWLTPDGDTDTRQRDIQYRSIVFLEYMHGHVCSVWFDGGRGLTPPPLPRCLSTPKLSLTPLV